MNIQLVLDQEILVYSFRYCLGRKTYAVSHCVGNILKNWDELSPRTKNLFYSEIKKCNDLGMEMDKKEWMKIINQYESDENI